MLRFHLPLVVENYERCGGDDEVRTDYAANNLSALDRLGRAVDHIWTG